MRAFITVWRTFRWAGGWRLCASVFVCVCVRICWAAHIFSAIRAHAHSESEQHVIRAFVSIRPRSRCMHTYSSGGVKFVFFRHFNNGLQTVLLFDGNMGMCLLRMNERETRTVNVYKWSEVVGKWVGCFWQHFLWQS